MAADAFIKFGADATAFFSSIKQMQKSVAAGCSSMTARLARLGQAFQAVSSIGGAFKAVGGGIMDAAKAIVAPAAEAETLALSFEVMLGSETAALEFMERLNQYAAETPFALDEISKAAKLMLANTSMSADEVMETLQRIGNLSAMTGKSMAEIAQVYAKAMNVGVTNEVAESLETMGIPIRKIIAELRGVSFEDVFDMISKRQLGAEHLNAALESLTTTGGKFDGATERLSQTFEGLYSTLEDNVNMALRKFGEELLPQIKPVLQKLIELVDKATPSFQRLGYLVGKWLGEKVNDSVLPALDEFILRIPELRVHLEYLLNKVLETVDAIMLIPNAIASVHSALKRWGNQVSGYLAYDFDWAAAGRWADRIEHADSAEGRRDADLKRLREQMDEELAWAEQQHAHAMAAAKERDAARAAEREANAEAKRANDERLRGVMMEAEARKKAAQEEKRLMAENQKQWENYQQRRKTWNQKQEEQAYSKQSIRAQERALRARGQELGVGEMTPEGIRARLDQLAAPGDQKEMAALDAWQKKWDALNQKQAKYTADYEEHHERLTEAARLLGVEGEVNFDALERRQAELGRLGAEQHRGEINALGGLKHALLEIQERRKKNAEEIAAEEKRLQEQAAAQGVRGVNSPEEIQRRLSELKAQGAKSNEREIADLEHLLEKWTELKERKAEYARTKAEAEMTLRADALDSLGHKQQAQQLREQLELAQRIEELKSKGASERDAQEMATAEAKVKKLADARDKIQNVRVEFVQSELASVGGGGFSYRIGGSQLDETRNRYLRNMERDVRDVLRKLPTSMPAVLA